MVVALWWTLIACPKRNEAVSTVDTWLTTADLAWENRATQGLAPVADALDQAWGVSPDNGRVRWRLARLSVAEGLVATDPNDQIGDYATARAQGLACLKLPPSFQEEGGANPFSRLTREHAPCVAWTAVAWARWYVAFGPDAAALDRGRIAALSDEAETLGADPGLIAWTRGILAATDADYPDASRQLHAAIDADPADLPRRADLILLVALPSADTAAASAEFAEMKQHGGDTPENKAAIAIVKSALSGG
jgi:hypothetical protein